MKNIMENIINGKLKLVVNTLMTEEKNKKKEILLNEDEYFIIGNNPVIRHDTLVRIAESEGFYINEVKLEFAVYNSNNNFCFVHRAYGTDVFGNNIDEVGEANPTNLNQDIAIQYPAIMSNKRAQDRLIIRMLGLQGQAYSQEEISSSRINTNVYIPNNKDKDKEKPKIDTKSTISTTQDIQNVIDNIQNTNNNNNITDDNDNNNINDNNFIQYKDKCCIEDYEILKNIPNLTEEEAKNLIVDFGKFRKDKPTLEILKKDKPMDFDWLLNTYKITDRSSLKMKKLKKGAIIIS